MENSLDRTVALGQVSASNWALLGFGVYMVGVFLLAWFSNRMPKGKSFVSEYFLGSRNLGMWAFALTFAATNASGGSFMGFPSLIYTHGWVLALWIASYMVVPLITMGFLAKQLNQVARRARAVTVPEVMRERFQHEGVGLIATLLLGFFMFFYLLAQFKAGAVIMVTLLDDVALFQSSVANVASFTRAIPFLNQVDPDYLLCLFVFAATVIWYTTYGGFRAVVWTDVMQGLVMVAGVLIMLGLILYQVGGLGRATREIAAMTPPEHGEAELQLAQPRNQPLIVPKGTWLAAGEGAERGIIRTSKLAVFGPSATRSGPIPILKITTPQEIERIQPSALNGIVSAKISRTDPYRYGANQRGVYLSAPGPAPSDGIGFLSLSMAMSFFVFWAFGGTGQPSNMVRLMAFKDTPTLRRAIAMVAVYYSLIYFPLVVIFVCARVLMPGMEIDSDRVMPELATYLTAAAKQPWLAGFLIAAPFAAVMSSVDSFLLMVSSAVVRDIYQRYINPAASESRIKTLSYCVTCLVGVAAVLGTLNPPQYLQVMIVFSTSGMAACFLVPMALGLYWPRMNGAGAVAGMIGGCFTHLLLYITGYWIEGRFTVYQLFGLQPFIWDLIGSSLCAIAVALATNPPSEELIKKFFGRENPPPPSGVATSSQDS